MIKDEDCKALHDGQYFRGETSEKLSHCYPKYSKRPTNHGIFPIDGKYVNYTYNLHQHQLA